MTSYLLIAFKSDAKAAVDGARRAIIVTTAGALAMLAGFVLLGQAVGTTNITAILATPGLTELPIYPVVLALILLGAFTKSAQWPFHFWLPGAMAAPTPASAYLHSATMVKAGVFLLARLQSGMGHDPLWFWSLFTVGGITMLVGGVSAIRYRDMKALLAYATVSVLGILVFLLAFPEPIAVTAVVVTVLAHALYKAPLFLTAGIVDHAMGTRDLRHLAGLARLMPFVAATAALAAISMAGVPPTFGFLSKELLLETLVDVQGHGQELAGMVGFGAAVVTAVFLGGAVFTLVWEAYFRRNADEEPAHLHHKPAFWFVAPALLLTIVGALAPLFVDTFQGALVIPAASSILGEPVTKTIKLWHGWTPVFITSLAILGLSVVLVLVRAPARRAWATLPARVSAVLAYDRIIDAVYRFAYEVTKIVQGSTLPSQISVTLLAGFVVAVYALLQGNWLPNTMQDSTESPAFYEWLIVLLGIIAAFTTVRARSRLSAIISLGVVGVVVTLFFIDFSAPDLALTQLLIEVLTVILLVLVFFRVKPDPPLPADRRGDRREVYRIVVAVALGVFGFTVAIITHFVQVGASISPYFIENAPTIGRGENVVNVILVDIRGYDTLGEITVLGLAALGGYALLRAPQLHALRRRLSRARHAHPAPALPPPAAPSPEAGHD